MSARSLRPVLLAALAAAAPLPPPPGMEGMELAENLRLKMGAAPAAEWRAQAWQAAPPEGAFGNIPARICLRPESGGATTCTILTHAASNSPDRIVFQTVDALRRVRLLDQPLVEGLLAEAETAYAGSGAGHQYALWIWQGAAQRFDARATYELTGQSEFRIIDTGKLAGSIVTADYIWGAGETHFARHHYALAVYHLDPATLTYGTVLKYVSAATYAGRDEADRISVIDPEMPHILRILHFIYPGRY